MMDQNPLPFAHAGSSPSSGKTTGPAAARSFSEFGMRTLSTVAPFGFDFDVDEFLATYAAFGCTGAQFYRNLKAPPTVEQAIKTCEQHGLSIDSMHGVFSHDIDPTSPDPAHREHCLELYRKEAQLSKELGGPVVVVHPAGHTKPPEGEPFNFPKLSAEEAHRMEKELWPAFDEFAKRLADIGEEEGVTFVLENMGYIAPLGHNVMALAEHVRAVGSERVRLCFDTGHAHFTGDMLEAFKASADVTAYIHLHDNDRLVDNHQMPGDGTIDWTQFAELLENYEVKVPCMIEVFTPLDVITKIDAAAYRAFISNACAITAAA
ncbi:MAG: sugar phosphate isomerase/epimerase family protein [Planctomycetota bacterium]